MQEKSFIYDEKLFEQFKEELKKELNIYSEPSDKELNDILDFIIKEYEQEFSQIFTEIFFYTYYKNLLTGHNDTMNKIIDFTENKKPLNDEGKPQVIKAERNDCYNTLYLYDLKYQANQEETKLISNITGQKIPVDYSAVNVITNNDIFKIPPKGDPNLRGPHIYPTIEYSPQYWQDFKNQIIKYIQNFETKHSQNFLADLEDYHYWLNKYHIFQRFLNQITDEQALNEGGKHVKN